MLIIVFMIFNYVQNYSNKEDININYVYIYIKPHFL